MARSPLFHTLERLLRYNYYARRRGFSPAQRIDYYFEQKERGLSRRQFLLGAAAGLFAPNIASAWRGKDPRSLASPTDTRPTLAIIGGGLAGLSSAYFLYTRYGIISALYEAGDFWGGRVHTEANFNAFGNYIDLGGEFIDTGHLSISRLCNELGVRLISKAEESDYDQIEQEIFWYGEHGGGYQSAEKVLHAFDPLIDAMIEKIGEICPSGKFQLPSYRNKISTEMEELDYLSLQAYLDSLSGRVDKSFRDMLANAYEGENGLDAGNQSVLNLFGLLKPKRESKFAIFGDSDELYGIKGGSQKLIEALLRRLPPQIELHPGHRLSEIRERAPRVELKFERKGNSPIGVKTSQVLFAIPFSSLRHVQGYSWFVSMRPEKRHAIAHLDYGNSAKVILGFQSRVWKDPGPESLVPPSSGTIYTDFKETQMVWDMSRQQPGDLGILTFLLGGSHAKSHTPKRVNELLSALGLLYPHVSSQHVKGQQRWKYWRNEPNFWGGYTCPSPGQYTKFRGVEQHSECGNRLFFAGEHCHPDFGYMNSAVASARTATQQIASSRRLALVSV